MSKYYYLDCPYCNRHIKIDYDVVNKDKIVICDFCVHEIIYNPFRKTRRWVHKLERKQSSGSTFY